MDDDKVITILGAGVAGVSAAATLHSLNVPFRWFTTPPPSNEETLIGGMLHRIKNPILNCPPFVYESGTPFVEQLTKFVHSTLSVQPYPLAIQEISLSSSTPSRFTLIPAPSTTYPPPGGLYSSFIILATGTLYRRLQVPGEPLLSAPWYHQSASHIDSSIAGKKLLVVGGGDAAFENALTLNRLGAIVHIASRSPYRARQHWVKNAQSTAIHLLPIPTTIRSFDSSDYAQSHKVAVTLDTPDGPRITHYDHCFIRVGVTPNTPILPSEIKRDPNLFIHVDRDGNTNIPGLYAAGDVTSSLHRSITTALGDGSRTARTAAIAATYFSI